MKDFHKTVVTTVITADTQCRVLLPIIITNATIFKLGTRQFSGCDVACEKLLCCAGALLVLPLELQRSS